jgi:hypothetical protein
MRGISRNQEDVSLSNSLTSSFALTVHVLEDHVPFELEEKLVRGINVEISPRVWPSDGHDHEFGVLPDPLSTDRRLEKMAMLFNPASQIKGSKRLGHACLL